LPAKGNHKSMGRAIFGQMKVYNLETDFVRTAHVKRKHKLKKRHIESALTSSQENEPNSHSTKVERQDFYRATLC